MSGRTPTVERGRFGARTVPIGWGQEMRDQGALVREACKWDYELRFPEQVPELLDRAHAIATSTPKGPVYLSLPREVLCEPCPGDELAAPISMQPSTIVASPAQAQAVAELLTSAKRPLIVAQRGTGSAEGFDALARIAEQWAIPVCQWWAVATAISSDHPMYVGQDPARWIGTADVILVLDSLAPWMPRGPPAASRLHGRAARAEPAVQPVPGAQLPVRPVDHERGRGRPAGPRGGDGRPGPGRGRGRAPAGPCDRPRRRPPRGGPGWPRAGKRRSDEQGLGVALRRRGHPGPPGDGRSRSWAAPTSRSGSPSTAPGARNPTRAGSAGASPAPSA